MSVPMTENPSIRRALQAIRRARRAPGPARGFALRPALFVTALFALLVLGTAAGPFGPPTAAAQEGTTYTGPEQVHPEAREAIGRLRSPYCPGLMLEVCPSGGADDLRDTLNIMAQDGVSSDSLVEWTLARYGEEWRAVPKTEGAGLFAWVIPPAVLALGIVAVVVALRRLRGDRRDDEEGAQISEEDERKLERAMQELEREGR